MTSWNSAEVGFQAACSRACVEHVVQVTPWPSSELGCRNHGLMALGKPGVLENLSPSAVLYCGAPDPRACGDPTL